MSLFSNRPAWSSTTRAKERASNKGMNGRTSSGTGVRTDNTCSSICASCAAHTNEIGVWTFLSNIVPLSLPIRALLASGWQVDTRFMFASYQRWVTTSSVGKLSTFSPSSDVSTIIDVASKTKASWTGTANMWKTFSSTNVSRLSSHIFSLVSTPISLQYAVWKRT